MKKVSKQQLRELTALQERQVELLREFVGIVDAQRLLCEQIVTGDSLTTKTTTNG